MKCPLSILTITQQFGKEHGIADCLKEECAWWDEVEDGRCAILSLVGSLDSIDVKLMHIDESLAGLKEDK